MTSRVIAPVGMGLAMPAPAHVRPLVLISAAGIAIYLLLSLLSYLLLRRGHESAISGEE